MTTTGKYFFTNSRRALKWDISSIIYTGNNNLNAGPTDPTGGKFLNFPLTSIYEPYTWFKQINGGNLNYSLNNVDIAKDCGAIIYNNNSYLGPGNWSVIVPDWATSIAFLLVGAGGGGGGGGWGSNNYHGTGGAGGGSGAVVLSTAIRLNAYGNISLTVGNNGTRGMGDPIASLSNGTAGGDTYITINGKTYTAGGGGGGEHGSNMDSPSGIEASGGRRGFYTVPDNGYTTELGDDASDVRIFGDVDGSSGSNGAGANVIPVSNYYPTIIRSGGTGGALAGDGGNGAVGTGWGGGGGGGGGSTNEGGTPGGNGGNGADGVARIVFYP